VAGYLYELPNVTIANAGVQGLWLNQPQPVVDLADLSWAE
jgi:hypothetical protein